MNKAAQDLNEPSSIASISSTFDALHRLCVFASLREKIYINTRFYDFRFQPGVFFYAELKLKSHTLFFLIHYKTLHF